MPKESDNESRGQPGAGDDAADVQTSGWVDKAIVAKKRDFPVSDLIKEPLRIAFTREAHAEIVSHAGEDLERELCGVLLGSLCEDAHGVWVSAEVALRGETDKQGGTHVTYTHETWEKIYEVKEKKYPKKLILGWYHTHPGFGVQFSEMDLFIQRNFFPGDTQFALVIDPLSGDEAIIANTPNDTKYVSRFWVNGKERTAKIPSGHRRSGDDDRPADVAISSAVDDRLRDIEERLAQVLQSTETQREAHGRMFVLFGFLIASMVAGFIGYSVLQRTWEKSSPPKELQMVNVPVRINDEVMMVGMQIRGWQVPDGENLLKQAQMDAEQRALTRALKIMQNPNSREAREALAASKVEDQSMLSPAFTFYWAVAATLIAMGLTVFQFWRR